MSDETRVIAIDGPAGSGKSTVAKAIARRLDWDYIDTGAMYRCLCLKALREDVSPTDEERLVSILSETTMRMTFEDGELKVYMDGEDVSESIRDNRVSKRVSDVAALSGVRERLVKKQRAMGEEGGVVMDGRDIGTVVFPDAKYKFYLDASLEIRAKRRYTQLKEQNEDVDLDSVVEEIKQRDETDRHRSSGPLKAAEDAIRVDTSDLTVEEVVDRLLQSIDSHEYSGQ
jgi:cytidylate kinase